MKKQTIKNAHSLPLLLGMFVLAACSALDDFGVFPCPEDGVCPRPLFCAQDIGCIKPDSLSVYPCSPKGQCPSSRLCVKDVGCAKLNECNLTPNTKVDCSDPSRPKCTVIADNLNVSFQCVAETGVARLNETCTRQYSGDLGFGRDNCATGLFCNSSVADPTLRCRQLCTSSPECNGWCLSSTNGLTKAKLGVCSASCTLNAQCAAGVSCRYADTISQQEGLGIACALDGPLLQGDECTTSGGSGECSRGTSCLGGLCRKHCSQNSDCGNEICDTDFIGTHVCTCGSNSYTDCGTGKSCKYTFLVFNSDVFSLPISTCTTDGTVAIGKPCSKNHDCVAHAVCYPTNVTTGAKTCLAVCDASHPCSGTQKCTNSVCQ